MVFLHLSQVTSVSGTLLLQYGHGVRSSSSFSATLIPYLGGFLTIASIFLLYLASTCPRYSGRISIAAKLKAALFKPALWHSITVEVNIGTMSRIKNHIYYIHTDNIIICINCDENLCYTNAMETSIYCWLLLLASGHLSNDHFSSHVISPECKSARVLDLSASP